MNPSSFPITNTLRPTVLMVDDSRVMRKAIGKILGDEFIVIEAEDGEDGWQKLTSEPEIQVVISDIEMPKLDGFGLMQRLRSFEDVRISQMPVIIITGAEDEETRQRALDQGATDFITKPVDRTQLLARTRAQARFTVTKRDLEETTITLKTESTHDPLTRLNSRRFFLQRGAQDIAYAKRHNQELALLRVDIDKFRRFYSDYGDEAVDAVLVWVASRLTAHARTEDTLARIGGSAFALLAPSTSPGEAMMLGERLRNALSQSPFQWQNRDIALTASVGLATLRNNLEADIDGLLKLAEKHLREARRNGGANQDADAGPVADTSGAEQALVVDEEIELTDLLPTASESDDIIVEGLMDLSESPDESIAIQKAAPTVDEALASLATGDTRKIEPYLWSLLIQFLPLLEHCNDKLDLGIGVATQVVRHKIDNPKEE